MNLDVLLREETGLPVMVCDDPISAVVLGSGKTLDHMELLKEVTIGELCKPFAPPSRS
jgi:rod shape-determining protein MreB and related proteins